MQQVPQSLTTRKRSLVTEEVSASCFWVTTCGYHRSHPDSRADPCRLGGLCPHLGGHLDGHRGEGYGDDLCHLGGHRDEGCGDGPCHDHPVVGCGDGPYRACRDLCHHAPGYDRVPPCH